MIEIRELKARERFQKYTSRFYQNVSLPSELVNCSQSLNFEEMNHVNQWRIDFRNNRQNQNSDEYKFIFSIAHKILTRGDYIPLSPFLEKKLTSKFECSGSLTFNAFDNTDQSKETSFWFDGTGYEKRFFQNILPKLLGDSFKRYVLPQVEFKSLVRNTYDESKERVDFLITTPKSNIVVEIDGLEHQQHRSKDFSRLRRLMKNGFKEIRIKNYEIDDEHSKSILALKKELGTKTINSNKKTCYDKYINSFKLSHQFQVSLVELLFEGILDCTEKSRIFYDCDSINDFSSEEMFFIINESLKDLKKLILNLSELYDLKINVENIELSKNTEDCDLVLTYNENYEFTGPSCVIQDILFPLKISKEIKQVKRFKIQDVEKERNLLFLLKYVFHFDSFREGQLESLKRILLKKDTITLLPTGSGKSLIFQLATLISPGITIVIAPIKSLMHDQVQNLEKKGINRAIAISSDIETHDEKNEIYSLIRNGQYLFLYIAPERFLIDRFRTVLLDFSKKLSISLIVIDEAHCVSEWGHDFRPAYLTVGKNSRYYCKNSDGLIPPLIALTGTASENVILDIKEDLEIKDDDSIISPETFDRQELNFTILKCESDMKYNIVKNLIQEVIPSKFQTESILTLNGDSTKSGIIFCPFTTNNENNPRGVRFYIEKLRNDFGNVCKPYYAKEELRLANANDFKENNFPLLVATKGYGMGIDKPNIRYIIHVNLPPSIEAFYQEAGRAGRDGNQAECFIIYSTDVDNPDTNTLLNLDTSLKDLRKVCNKRSKWDDVRSLFHFHINNFKGKDLELKIINEIIEEIDELNKEYHPYSSKFNNIDKNIKLKEPLKAKQKAIFRLTAIGVVSNYSIDYASGEFNLHITKVQKKIIIDKYTNYVKKYNRLRAKEEKKKLLSKNKSSTKEFVMYCCKLLLDYVYDYYEKGRRQAMSTMLFNLEETINQENQDKIFRETICNYFKRTYSKQLINIANAKDLSSTLYAIREIIEGAPEIDSYIKPISDYKSLFSQISRVMEDFPESLGLYLLRSYARVRINEEKIGLIIYDINQFLRLSFEEYHLKKEEVYETIYWLLTEINLINEDILQVISKELIETIKDDSFTKGMVEYMDSQNISLIYPKLKLILRLYEELEENVYKEG